MALKPGMIYQIANQRFWLLHPTVEAARSRIWSRACTALAPGTAVMVVDEINDTDGVRCQIKVVDSDGNFGWINVMLYTDDQLSESFKPLSETG